MKANLDSEPRADVCVQALNPHMVSCQFELGAPCGLTDSKLEACEDFTLEHRSELGLKATWTRNHMPTGCAGSQPAYGMFYVDQRTFGKLEACGDFISVHRVSNESEVEIKGAWNSFEHLVPSIPDMGSSITSLKNIPKSR